MPLPSIPIHLLHRADSPLLGYEKVALVEKKTTFSPDLPAPVTAAVCQSFAPVTTALDNQVNLLARRVPQP